MSKRNFLTGVGIIALSGALAASPAYASGGATAAGPEAPVTETANERIQWRLDLMEARGRGDRASVRDVPAATPPAEPAAPVTISAPTPSLDSFVGFNELDVASMRLDASEMFTGSASSITQFRVDTTLDTLVAQRSINPEIFVRDDIGLAGIFDADNTQPSVVQLLQLNNATGQVFLNCTGTVINPRTILTAAHCVNSRATRSSEAYGLPETGAAFTQVIVSGNDTSGRFFNWLNTDAGYNEGGAALGTDVIIHASSNPGDGGLPFPFADIALIAVDAPITDVPSMPILLSPLTELTRVILTGYGQFGTAIGGRATGSNFLRRVGENMLGLAGSFADFDDVVFSAFAPNALDGSITQPYYFTDFDWPDRDLVTRPGDTEPGGFGCTFQGFGPQCQFVGDVWANDWFDGDALPREVTTAPGDSGSPLIVPDLYDFPVVAGVLSGGLNFFASQRQRYGDISFYNPLYNFFEFISENTAYKYVSAAAGDGVWSDPTRWTQDLDPGFFIDDGNGNLVNGLPAGSEEGIFATGPKVGTVLGTDISGFPNIVSPFGPQPGDPNFGANTPNSSVLLGPGSTGFVPQNTDGTPGQSFANPAQYFEVHLNRAGTTTVDLDVEIDRLVIDNSDAGFVLPTAWEFTSLINVEQLSGSAVIDGTLNTPVYALGSGELSGNGTINTNALFNLSGLLSAGGTGDLGAFSVNGDYVQTSGGAMWADLSIGRRGVTGDFYDISGVAVLSGELIVSAVGSRPRFGSVTTILEAGAIDGDFEGFTFLGSSPILAAEYAIDGNTVTVEITARSIRDVVGRRSMFGSLGGTLDSIRDTNFAQFSNLFALVDGATVDTLGATLASLAPTNAFQQTFTANSFSQRFTGQLSQRTLALRGGSSAAGNFSAAGNAAFALAGSSPTQNGSIGVFGTASGMFLNGGQQGGVLGNGSLGFDAFGVNGSSEGGVFGANAFEQAALIQAGEMTVGADMRVSDNFSFGVAVSNIVNSELSTSALRPQEDRSQSVAVYMSWADGGLFADGYAGAADQRLGVERQSEGEFTSAFANAIGQADSTQTFGGMRLGYAFDLADGMEIGPVVSVDYVRNEIGGYDEIGAGSFGLSVADRSFTSLSARTGAMASFDIRSGERTSIRAFGSVAYAQELGDTQDIVTASFFGAADTPFTIVNELDSSWVSVNAGAEMAIGNNLSAQVSVTSDMGRGLLSNDQGRVSLSWRF